MGMLFSCSIVGYDPLSYGSESLFSITDNVRSTLQSISFDDSETFRQGTEQIEGLVNLDGSEMDLPLAPAKSIKSDEPKTLGSCHLRKRSLDSILIRPDSPKHDEAAVKLQKVYKSFRTRRQLADCAVVAEQRWWKLLDFALLRRSSVSFFDIEKQESAVSRWSRAKSRAAKVGKGLSKDDKAQKLALQHWLEAIDPRHRYGHNLQFYYDRWLQCESKQPFFYWLDVGAGKEVNLQEQCSRSKLQEECIKYLGPKEREAYEVTIEDGKFMYRQSMQLLDTSHGQRDAKWIFVLSTSRKLYVGQKHKGKFQHSSFLAGGATSSAGRLVVENGALKAVWHHSGHYRPTEENFHEFMGFLKENNVNLTDVKKTSIEEDGEVSSGLTKGRSELNLAERSDASHSSSIEQMRIGCADPKVELKDKLICMQPNHNADNQHEDSDEEDNINVREPTRTSSAEEDEQALATSSDADTETIFQEKKLFVQDQGDDEETIVPSELILRRINSKKGIQSYQLGKQLSCKWTTGAGPRIGCVRDYPSELQFRALEQVNLSPRSLKTSRLSLPRIAKCQSPTAHESSAEELPQPASS